MARKKQNLEIITKEQMSKIDRAARRQVDLERGNLFIRGGPHKGTKRDVEEELSNTLSMEEVQELIEEELYE